MSKKLSIRNSTVEFLVFSKQAGESTIEVRIEDETVWLSQKLIAVLFDVEVNTINYHIKEVFKTGEQKENATIRNFRIVQTEGKAMNRFKTNLDKLFAESRTLEAEIKKQLEGLRYE